MPELPEVETIRRDLARLIAGKEILDIRTDSEKQVKPSVKVVKKAAVGKRIVGVKRRAKVLIIELGAELFFAVHLKLTGRLLVRKKGDPKDDWQRVTISLSGEKELRFCDLRKFGWIKVIAKSKKQRAKLFGDLGPEPMTREFTLGHFREVLASTGRAVKIILMDQKKISGVGNIYANEALFLAKIRPDRPAKRLSNLEVKKLREAIEKVLKAGIKYRGASDQYYLDALGRKGSYQDHFLVYRRDGEKCFDCKEKIERVKIGGRGTFFCQKCQK